MLDKKIVVLSFLLSAIIFLSTGCLKKELTEPFENEDVVKKEVLSKTVPASKKIEKKYDLYSSSLYDLPLFSIMEISNLSPEVKQSVDKVLELAQGFYLLQFDGERVLVILQNPAIVSNTYQRHGLQFAEITMDGKVVYHTAGYSGVDGEIYIDNKPDNDMWIYDRSCEFKRPEKHIAYDEKGKIRFTEYWNYDEKDPIKYQMKDHRKNLISILKETQDDEFNLRREHIFYDNEGNIKMSLGINYDGSNISRVTFYNSHDAINSISILSEFEDGFKKKEFIYNENYELINTVIANYIDGERKNIIILDKNGVELRKISS